jgi:hypothetical protein
MRCVSRMSRSVVPVSCRSTNDAQVDVLRPVPHVQRSAGLEPLKRRGERDDREDHEVFGDRPVVHHRRVRRLEPGLVDDATGRVRLVVGDVPRRLSLGHVAEEHELTGARIDLRVCGRRLGRQIAVPGELADRVQRVRVDLDRCAVLLGGEQPAAVPVHVRVGEPAAQPRHARVVGERVSVGAEQRPPRLPFRHEARRPHVPGLEVAVAVPEAEHRDHAVGVEVEVALDERRPRRVRTDPVERAAQLRGDLPLRHLDPADLALKPHRCEPALEAGLVREPHRHLAPPFHRVAPSLGRAERNPAGPPGEGRRGPDSHWPSCAIKQNRSSRTNSADPGRATPIQGG